MPNLKPTNPKDVIGTGKLPIGLVPDALVAFGALGFLEGALKYGRFNWRVAGVRASIYHDALRRHLAKWWNGEDRDAATGIYHLSNAVACLGVLVDAMACGKLTDDRPPRAPTSALVDSMAADVARLKGIFADHDPHQWTIDDKVE